MSKLQQTRTVQDVVRQTIQTYDKIASEYCKKTRQSKFLEWEENYKEYRQKASPFRAGMNA
jgi:hypothetical protein